MTNFLVEQFCSKIQTSKKNLYRELGFSQLLNQIERLQKYHLKIQDELAKRLASHESRLKLLQKTPKEGSSHFNFFEKTLITQTNKILNDLENHWVYWKAEIKWGERKNKTLYLLPIGYLHKKEGELPQKITELMINSDAVYVTNKAKNKKNDKKINKKIQESITNSQDRAVYEKNLKIVKDLNLLRDYRYYPFYDLKRLCNRTFIKMINKRIKIKQLYKKGKNFKHEMRHRIVYNSLLKPLRLYPSKLLAHEEFQVIAFKAMRTGKLSEVNKAKKDLLKYSEDDKAKEIKETQQLASKIIRKLKKKNEIFCAIDFTYFINGRILKILKQNEFKICQKQVQAEKGEG